MAMTWLPHQQTLLPLPLPFSPSLLLPLPQLRRRRNNNRPPINVPLQWPNNSSDAGSVSDQARRRPQNAHPLPFTSTYLFFSPSGVQPQHHHQPRSRPANTSAAPTPTSRRRQPPQTPAETRPHVRHPNSASKPIEHPAENPPNHTTKQPDLLQKFNPTNKQSRIYKKWGSWAGGGDGGEKGGWAGGGDGGEKGGWAGGGDGGEEGKGRREEGEVEEFADMAATSWPRQQV